MLYRVRSRSRRARSLTPRNISMPHLIIIAWCAFRVAAIGSALANLPAIIDAAVLPAATWTLLGLVVVETVALLVALLQSKGLPSRSFVVTDVALTGLVALSPLFHPASPLTPFLPWHFALVFTTICLVAMRFESAATVVGLVSLLGALYVAGRFAFAPGSSIPLFVSSGFTVLMVFALGATFSRYLMQVARRMDGLVETNVRLAARAAVANERATQRVFLHDTAGLLAMIANTTDPELSAVLRDRARATSKELRAYVYEERKTELGPSRSLQEVLERAAADFRDLPIEQNTLLAKNVFLTGDAIQAVESALRTVLDNIRVHANARNVIIHGRSTGVGWEVTVRDDGVGFDPASTKKGFGLRDQVESQCALAGITVRLTSRPGEGTEISLRGSSSPLGKKPSRPDAPARSRSTVTQQWRALRGQPSRRG